MPEQAEGTGGPLNSAAPRDRATARRPLVWRVLTASILDAFRPRAAARDLLAAGRLLFASLVTLNLLVYAGVLIALMLWAGTVQTAWTAPATLPTATSATAPTALPFWGRTEVEERTIGVVWREWREDAIDGWLGPAELTAFIVLVLGAAGLGSLAWMNLPFVHATGPVWASFTRALRAAAAVLWPLNVLTLAGGALPDYRWARKVIVYETAYVWAFCIYWGTLVTSFILILFEDWRSRAVGLGGWGGGAIESLALFGGTAALAVLCVARYITAYRAIRWSNY